MRLEKSVSKMGLRSLGCWTNDPVIKKTQKFRRDFRFSRVQIFRLFENHDFGEFDQCTLYSFFRSFSLWQRGFFSTKQMMVYDQITFFIKCSICFSICLRCKNHGFLGRRHQARGLFNTNGRPIYCALCIIIYRCEFISTVLLQK